MLPFFAADADNDDNEEDGMMMVIMMMNVPSRIMTFTFATRIYIGMPTPASIKGFVMYITVPVRSEQFVLTRLLSLFVPA